MTTWSIEYSFVVDEANRIIYEKIYGIWKAETAAKYHEDFKQAVAPLVDQPWAKLVDLVNWKTSYPQMVKVVADHLRWCREHNMALSLNVLNNPSTYRQLREMFTGGGTEDISHTFRDRRQAEAFLRENWIDKLKSK